MIDHTRVVFHESRRLDEEFPLPRPEPRGMAHVLLRFGIVNAPGDAAIVLTLFAILLIAVNAYIVAALFQPEPSLGNDILQPGEVVPAYVLPQR